MLRVALTGGIATGKSHIAALMREHGVPVVDADVLAREAVAPGSAGLRAVVERFGAEVLLPDGSLDRARLADIVFGDRDLRLALEGIVHPIVRSGIDRFWRDLPSHTPFAVADIPLLYETGRPEDFDAVVVAACPAPMQVQRIIGRDSVSRARAEARLAAQLPIDEKRRRADYVIDTSTTFEATGRQVDEVVRALASRAAGQRGKAGQG